MELHIILRGQRATEGYSLFKSWVESRFGLNDGDDSMVFMAIRQNMIKDRKTDLPDILNIMEENERLKMKVQELSVLVVSQRDRIQSLEAQWAINKVDPIKPESSILE